MALTYEPIATTTLSSTTGTITFSSIPATYTDLRLVLIETATSGGGNVTLRFNSSTTGYSSTAVEGTGTSALSFRDTSSQYIRFDRLGSSTTVPSFKSADIFSYTNSTYKSTLLTSNQDTNGSGGVCYTVGLWQNTSTITSLSILSFSLFKIGTTATLYGIKAA